MNLNPPVHQNLFEYLPEPLIDNVGGGVTYVGYAPLGVAENAPGWRILRRRTVGTVLVTEYANGSMQFNARWDQRASLTYSR